MRPTGVYQALLPFLPSLFQQNEGIQDQDKLSEVGEGKQRWGKKGRGARILLGCGLIDTQDGEGVDRTGNGGGFIIAREP